MLRGILHINQEEAKIELSNNSTDFASQQYRTMFIGKNFTMFIRDEQLELMFDLIDIKLHDKTYLQQQDEIFSLSDELDAAKEIIQYYRDLEEEKVKY
jgi:hypothetical protein